MRISRAATTIWLASMLVVSLAFSATADEAGVKPAAVSFRYDVLAALSKHSCSSGACHGSPTGKGGFRLSLRGFDAEFDGLTLIREDLGRRTTVFSPEDSLLLAKPTMRVAHGGGQRLKKTDRAYQLIRDWIAQGCRPDAPGSSVCLGIEVSPKIGPLQLPATPQKLTAIANFSDGTKRDVTDLCVFTSSDEETATVDAEGIVTSKERGEATILVRYLDHIDTVSFTFLRDVPGFAWSNPPEQNFIDAHVSAKLKQLQLPPAELCTDNEFIRRVHLDLLGILPERKVVEAFASDPSPDKRTKLIDSLLERPEYAEFWALKWADLLRVKSGRLGSSAAHKLHRWLVRAVQENRPYDSIARELLTASGSTLQNPPAGFYRAAADMNDCAETTAQLFLGIRIQCAKCHNHPFDRWSQDNYYGIGAFFARVGRTNLPGGDETLVYSLPRGEVTQPRTNKQVQPWLPGVEPAKLATASGEDRRDLLGRLLATKDNRLFAEVAANRIWGHLLGRGIVEPVDDFRPSNPPSNKELLAALTDEFIRTGFNQKELIRTILKSRTYQLSSQSPELSRRDVKYFSHAASRLLSAEQLLDAISSVTGTPESFPGLPAGTRAGQLPSPELGTHFLKVFGQPSRDTACECERGHDPKLTQALQLINGPMITAKLQAPASRLSRRLDVSTERVQAAGEPPRKNLALWLRADSGVLNSSGQPATNGAAVTTWRDQSDSKREAVQADANKQPVYIAQGTGGLPALRFDGSNDLLTNDKDILVESGKERTIFVVGRAAKEGHGGCVFCFRRSTEGGGTVFAVQHGVFAGVYYVYSDGINSSGNTGVSIERRKTIDEPFVSAFVSRGGGEKLQLAVNGETQPLSQPGAVGPDAGAAGFTVGSREDIPPGGQNWQGDLSEILVYDRALSAEELTATGSYLATKYALKTAYPAKLQAAGPETTALARELIIDFYYAALSRPPSEEELKEGLAYIAQADEPRQGLEDLCWALVNSKEFLFRH
ncbi:MAG: DUF1549 domain-containing protein [Pirellulaceae bacterium]